MNRFQYGGFVCSGLMGNASNRSIGLHQSFRGMDVLSRRLTSNCRAAFCVWFGNEHEREKARPIPTFDDSIDSSLGGESQYPPIQSPLQISLKEGF